MLMIPSDLSAKFKAATPRGFFAILLSGLAAVSVHNSASAAPVPEYILPSGEWQQLVVPGNSENVSVQNMFGDNLPASEYGDTWVIFRWDAAAGAYSNPGLSGSIPVGSGFWMQQITGTDVALDVEGIDSAPVQESSACTSSNGCTEIPLVSASDVSRDNMLGSALPVARDIESVQLRTSAGDGSCANGCSTGEAASLGLVDAAIWRYEPDVNQYVDLTVGGVLNPWESVWIKTSTALEGKQADYLFVGATDAPTDNVSDSFDGNGPLQGYTTNNESALPDVERRNGRYHATLLNNDSNVTLHFNQSQGRLDAKRVSFPFEYVARNIGIGTLEDSQVPPNPNAFSSNPFMFAGIQIHALDLDKRDSAHFVVGHRGSKSFTVEGKNTVGGNSAVNDAGEGIVPDGRADLRVVGSADKTLTWYWQQPNPNPGSQADDWIPYRGSGNFPGNQANFGDEVYIGLITYAWKSTSVPFVGTCDAVELVDGAI